MRQNKLLLTLVFALCIPAVVLVAFNGAPAQANVTAQATATVQATAVPPAAVQSFAAIVSPGSDRVLFLVLNLQPDGQAELVADTLDDNPPVTQEGVWKENDSTVTLTLTSQDGRALASPVTLVFARNADRLDATEYETATYGDRGLFFTLRDRVDEKISSTPRAYVTLDLAAGFPLDPFFVSVNGGGELDASALSDTCHGYIHSNPTVVVNWTGAADMVRAFTYSDADPVLIVQTPTGEFLCADDANALALDSQLEIAKPAQGRYRVWIGSAEPNQLLPTVLVLTARPDVKLFNFQLGDLVKRPPVPEENSALPASTQTNTVTDAIARFTGEVGGPLGATPLTKQVSSAGTVAAFDMDFDAARCNGYIMGTPDYVFEISTAPTEFTAHFSSEQDATLIVVGPNGGVYCNDDSEQGVNQNPAVTVTKPETGRYAVFVGRIEQDTPVTGTLTISTDPNAAPAVLPPSN